MEPVFLKAAQLLAPETVLADHGLLVQDGRIEDIRLNADAPSRARQVDLGDAILAPGFIDLQVNGGGGVLFNDAPDADAIRTIGAAHRSFGTTGFLPTLISDSEEKMAAAMAAVETGLSEAVPGLLGLHLEGPFLSPERAGIHDSRTFRGLGEKAFSRLTAPRRGALMMTLAPEIVPPETIGRLARAGVRVAAGHTAATYEATRDAIDAGLRGFTHLFNAMPPLLSRAPGPVGAALESDAWCSIIADGHHVSDAVLRIALGAKRDGRMIFVTDAMPGVGSDHDSFHLAGKTIHIREGRCVDDEGTLAGAHLTMIGAVRRGVEHLGLALPRAVAMASAEPADFLGIAEERGRLAPGLAADIVVLSQELDVRGAMIGGRWE